MLLLAFHMLKKTLVALNCDVYDSHNFLSWPSLGNYQVQVSMLQQDRQITSCSLQQPYSSASERFPKTTAAALDQRPSNFPSMTSIQDRTMLEFEDVTCYSQFLLQG